MFPLNIPAGVLTRKLLSTYFEINSNTVLTVGEEHIKDEQVFIDLFFLSFCTVCSVCLLSLLGLYRPPNGYFVWL
jgi:hypothetical protein